jgi:hypothetical protein
MAWREPMTSTRTTRFVGFIAFGVVAQFAGWQSRIDVLEDATIFSHPQLLRFLLLAAVLWFGLDVALGRVRKLAARYGLFAFVVLALFAAAVSYPCWGTGDGLAVGPMGFVMAEWVVVVGLYGIVVWAAAPAIASRFAGKRPRDRSEHTCFVAPKK